ncbi:TPA: phage tail protein [Pseudomonas aeruginosa]|nr:phage tail protein [Pseudomonas aeruginosa]
MTAPIIHIAHPLTGEYLGTGYADPDPQDAENWLVPAHAYLDAPPEAPANQTPVRVEGSWTLLPDYRGTVYRTDNGEAVEHSELGDLPEGVTAEPRPSPSHVWTADSWVFSIELQNANHGALKVQLCKAIDAEADIARRAVAGDPLRAVEYEKAASEAQAFKDAGYPGGAVPRTVAAWAINGRTAQQAADNILAEAAAYNEALYQIREARLAAKELVRQAMAANQVEQARLIASSTIDSIRAAITGLGNAGA